MLPVETETSQRTQTLNHKPHTKIRRPRFTRFSKMPTSWGSREIYWWFT